MAYAPALDLTTLFEVISRKSQNSARRASVQVSTVNPYPLQPLVAGFPLLQVLLLLPPSGRVPNSRSAVVGALFTFRSGESPLSIQNEMNSGSFGRWWATRLHSSFPMIVHCVF